VTVAVRCRDYSQLLQALSARRRALGLTQRDADEVSGLQPGYVSTLECGRRHLGSLSLPMLCAAYDIDILVAARSDLTPTNCRGLSATAADRFEPRALPAPVRPSLSTEP
jgi:transcriptional regulator with XRE-family HTH domain